MKMKEIEDLNKGKLIKVGLYAIANALNVVTY